MDTSFLRFGRVALVATLFLTATPASGASILVSASAGQVPIGANVNVVFNIDGLSAAAGDSLSAFDLDVFFDPSILALVAFGFVDATSGANQLDHPEPGAFPYVGDMTMISEGHLDIFGLSGNSPAVLDALQNDSFDFLTLMFSAIAPSALTTVAINAADPFLLFLDSEGASLLPSASSTFSAGVSVTDSTEVPEPAAAILMLLALAAGRRRYRRSADSK